jgi:hypothetical protein
MPSRGNGWQTPFSTAGSGHTLEVRRALDSPVHRPDRGTRKRLRVSSVRNAEETWPPTGIGRSRFAPALVAPIRQREVTAIVVRRNTPSRLGTLAQSRGSWALDTTYLPRQSRSDSGAMQILATTDNHVDAVPDLVARVRNEILKSMSRFSQGVTLVEVHLSDHNADRGEHEFGIPRATGRVASAFRRASFEVTVWDGRPLSCRGLCG